MNSIKRFTLPLILVAVLGLGFFGGQYYEKQHNPKSILSNIINQDVGKPEGVDFALFWAAWNELHDKFVDSAKLDSQELVYGAIDGMVKAAGDPYTVFFPPKESEAFNQQIEGSFGGVGIEIGTRDNMLTVISPVKDTPADRAGIMPGDVIFKIDSIDSLNMTVDEAVTKIRGPKGTSVILTIARKGVNDHKEYKLVREAIKVPALAWKITNDNVAYIQLAIFNKNADDEFKKAAKEILASKAKYIVLDLRNDPGGLLDSAVYIAGYFLDQGQLVTTQRSSDGSEIAYKANGNASLKKYPILILTNRGSASASEILAGALKDNRGIMTVGERTFGKGSVQEVVDFNGGSSLKVTVAKWLTPKGISIQEHGIDVDVPVEVKEEDVTAGKDAQFDKAIELIKKL